jgi:hypothetical protein
MQTRVSVRAAALGAAVAATGLARAAAAEAVHFTYTAPASCPAEAALVAAIVRNGGQLTRESDTLPARSFAVSVEEGRGVTGHLTVRGLAGEEAVRTIHGARCEDVVSSLGVLMSLALDPDSAGPAPEPAPVPDVAPRPPAPVAEKDSPQPKDPPGPLPYGWRFGASTETSLGGLGTMVAAGLGAYVDLVHDVPDWSAFALRLGADVAWSGVQNGANLGSADLQRRVLRVEACPARLVARQPWDTSTIELWACARLEGGVVQASEGPSSDSVTNPWLAPGGKLGLRWVARHFFLELGGSLMFPLYRELALSTRPADQYRVPGSLADFGLGFGWFVL